MFLELDKKRQKQKLTMMREQKMKERMLLESRWLLQMPLLRMMRLKQYLSKPWTSQMVQKLTKSPESKKKAEVKRVKTK